LEKNNRKNRKEIQRVKDGMKRKIEWSIEKHKLEKEREKKKDNRLK
jgi:hypothetical protein